MTGQPDFATVRIAYVPDRSIVELKSLKLYLWSYRDQGAFHEDVTNRILDDLVAAIAPRRADGDHRLAGPRGDPHRGGGLVPLVRSGRPPAGPYPCGMAPADGNTLVTPPSRPTCRPRLARSTSAPTAAR